MRICAIIAEYNPFHNGHAYQLTAVRQQLCPDAIIVLMSGAYVQRGTPAVLDPYTRAETAVRCGADLVLELPVYAATASAAEFAAGAVTILDRLGAVTDLVFGVEHAALEGLQEIASLLVDEPACFSRIIKEKVESGLSFPNARMLAVEKSLGSNTAALLAEPNHILAVEYLKALKKLGSSIRPHAIRRTDKGYHSLEEHNGCYSATALRQRWTTQGSPSAMKIGLPKAAASLLDIAYPLTQTAPLGMRQFHDLLFDRLVHGDTTKWQTVPDLSVDFANRLATVSDDWPDYDCLTAALKNKSLTASRIRRHLLHLLLGINRDEIRRFQACIRKGSLALNVLALSRTGGAPVCARIQRKPDICLLTNPGRQKKGSLPADYLPLYERQLQMNRLYYYMLHKHYGLPLINELRHGAVILP